MKKIIFLCVLSLIGCGGMKFTKTVSHVDMNRYLGKQYVISARGIFVENEAYNSTETYTWNERLPKIVELESLTDMSQHSPALPVDHLFVNVQEFYWFSTTSKHDINYAWVLNMKDGAAGLRYKPLSEFYL